VRADIGIALDGDADRVIIVDETGKLVDGDQLMAAIAQSWKQDGRLSRPGIVATVMSNLGLERYLEGLGLTLARTAVGDRYVLEHMREQGFNLGGEQSGHIILLDHCTTGDGLVAALQLLAIVKREGKPVSQLCRRFEPVPQVLKNARLKTGRSLADASVAAVIEDGRVKLGKNGRLVVRASGTEPVIRVMGEGDDRDLIERVVDDICAALSASLQPA
jgi:phosphoglucosamine mutase